jgi:2-polyprenyl-3-methyl-5-hydroxy-6-metoxy-1,4-benzoquinol methylase
MGARMATDPFEQFKATQREGWALFSPVAAFTVPPAALLVDYARVRAGQEVRDVGCGTGVVALTAARSARARGRSLPGASRRSTQERCTHGCVC